MPSPQYLTPWSPRIHFTAYDRKPTKAQLPGLDTTLMVKGTVAGRTVWRCWLNGLLSN